MGSITSKAAKGASKRQYPTSIPSRRAPASESSPSKPTGVGPTVHPKPQASTARDQAIESDALDPQLASSLRRIGPVTPSPTYSPSSTFSSPANDPRPAAQGTSSSQAPSSPYSAPIFPGPAANPALRVLSARGRLSDEAEAEFAALGRCGFAGRRFLDVGLVREMLALRDNRGMGAEEIEKRMGLKSGVVEKLGRKGIVRDVGGVERGEEGIGGTALG